MYQYINVFLNKVNFSAKQIQTKICSNLMLE